MTRIGYSGKVMDSMRYTRITSASNQHIRDAIQIRGKRGKFKHTAFLIEGPHLLEMAANGGAQISEVFATEAFMGKKEHQGYLRRMDSVAGEIFEVTDQVMGRITDTGTPQGIAAVVSCQPVKPGELALQQRSRTPAILARSSEQLMQPGQMLFSCFPAPAMPLCRR